MLKKTLALIAILIGFGYAQEKPREPKLFHPDSTITTTLEEVNVTASKEKPEEKNVDAKMLSLFYNDQDKYQTIRPGVITSIVGNISSEFSLDGIMYELTGMTLDNIRIFGTRTQWMGAKPKFISKITDPEIQNTAYSSKYSSIGGFMKVEVPQPNEKFSASADANLIDRRLTTTIPEQKIFGYNTSANIAVKQLEVLPVLKNNVEELKLLPTGYETQLNFTTQKIEGLTKQGAKFFGMIARQYQNYEGENFDVETVTQNNTHYFGKADFFLENESVIAVLTLAMEEEQLKSEYSSEKETSRIQSHIKVNSINLETKIKKIDTNFGLTTNLYTDINDKQTIEENEYKAFAEKEFIAGGLWIRPNATIVTNGKEIQPSGNISASYFFNSTELEGSIGRYSTFIYDNNVRVGKGVWRKKEEKPATATHYNLSLKNNSLTGIINEFELSMFYKEINAEYTNQGYSTIISRGIRFYAESKQLRSYAAIFVSNPKMNGGLVPSVTENQIQYLYWHNITESLVMNAQIDARTGIIIKNKETGIYERQQGGIALNLGFTQTIELNPIKFDITLTGFNLLEPLGATIPLGRTVDSLGETKIFNAPVWIDLNIQIRYAE